MGSENTLPNFGYSEFVMLAPVCMWLVITLLAISVMIFRRNDAKMSLFLPKKELARACANILFILGLLQLNGFGVDLPFQCGGWYVWFFSCVMCFALFGFFFHDVSYLLHREEVRHKIAHSMISYCIVAAFCTFFVDVLFEGIFFDRSSSTCVLSDAAGGVNFLFSLVASFFLLVCACVPLSDFWYEIRTGCQRYIDGLDVYMLEHIRPPDRRPPATFAEHEWDREHPMVFPGELPQHRVLHDVEVDTLYSAPNTVLIRSFDCRGKRAHALLAVLTLAWLAQPTHVWMWTTHVAWRVFVICASMLPVVYWQWFCLFRPVYLTLINDARFIESVVQLCDGYNTYWQWKLDQFDIAEDLDYYTQISKETEGMQPQRVLQFLKCSRFNDRDLFVPWRLYVDILRRNALHDTRDRVAATRAIITRYFSSNPVLQTGMTDERLLTVLLSPCEPDDSIDFFGETLTALTHILDQGRSKRIIERAVEAEVQQELFSSHAIFEPKVTHRD